MLNRDNLWHDGIIYQRPGETGYTLANDVQELENDPRVASCESQVGYHDVKYNWNRGQPIIDFGDFKMTIVDHELKKTI